MGLQRLEHAAISCGYEGRLVLSSWTGKLQITYRQWEVSPTLPRVTSGGVGVRLDREDDLQVRALREGWIELPK